jgi:hypothetical protein
VSRNKWKAIFDFQIVSCGSRFEMSSQFHFLELKLRVSALLYYYLYAKVGALRGLLLLHMNMCVHLPSVTRSWEIAKERER